MEVCCGLSHFVALVRHVVESDSASAEEDGVKGTSVVTCTHWCSTVQRSAAQCGDNHGSYGVEQGEQVRMELWD